MIAVDRASSQNVENGCCASIFQEENKGNTTIQAALITIVTTAIIFASFSYCGYLPSFVGTISLGFSAIFLISLGIFRSYTSSELDRRIDQCVSFVQLKEILDATEMQVSCLGKRDLVGDAGQSTVDHLARCVERKIAVHLQDVNNPESFSNRFHPEFTGKTFVFDSSERAVGRQLVADIDQLFNESERIVCDGNPFTYLCYYIPRFFKSMICYNDIRNRYEGETSNGYCMVDTIQVSEEEIKKNLGFGRMPRRRRDCLS